jgi:hypothetical protein
VACHRFFILKKVVILLLFDCFEPFLLGVQPSKPRKVQPCDFYRATRPNNARNRNGLTCTTLLLQLASPNCTPAVRGRYGTHHFRVVETRQSVDS